MATLVSQQQSQQRASDNVWTRRRQVQGRERPTLALRKSSSNADAVTAAITRETPSLATALSLDKPDSLRRLPRSAGGRPRGTASKASQLARDAVAGEAAARRQERKRGEAEPASQLDGKDIDDTPTSFELLRLPGVRGTKTTDGSRCARNDASASNDTNAAAAGFGSGNEEESLWEEGKRVGRSSLGSHGTVAASENESIFPRDGSYARDEEYSNGEHGDAHPVKTNSGNPSAREVDDFPGFSMTPPAAAAAAAHVESESESDREAPGGATEVVAEKCGWSRVAGRSSSVSASADPAGSATSQKRVLLQRGSQSQRVCSETDVVTHPSPLPSSLSNAAESLTLNLSSPASPTIDETLSAGLKSAGVSDGPTLDRNLNKAGVAGELMAQPPPLSAHAMSSGFSPEDEARTTASGLTAVGLASHAKIDVNHEASDVAERDSHETLANGSWAGECSDVAGCSYSNFSNCEGLPSQDCQSNIHSIPPSRVAHHPPPELDLTCLESIISTLGVQQEEQAIKGKSKEWMPRGSGNVGGTKHGRSASSSCPTTPFPQVPPSPATPPYNHTHHNHHHHHPPHRSPRSRLPPHPSLSCENSPHLPPNLDFDPEAAFVTPGSSGSGSEPHGLPGEWGGVEGVWEERVGRGWQRGRGRGGEQEGREREIWGSRDMGFERARVAAAVAATDGADFAAVGDGDVPVAPAAAAAAPAAAASGIVIAPPVTSSDVGVDVSLADLEAALATLSRSAQGRGVGGAGQHRRHHRASSFSHTSLSHSSRTPPSRSPLPPSPSARSAFAHSPSNRSPSPSARRSPSPSARSPSPAPIMRSSAASRGSMHARSRSYHMGPTFAVPTAAGAAANAVGGTAAGAGMRVGAGGGSDGANVGEAGEFDEDLRDWEGELLFRPQHHPHLFPPDRLLQSVGANGGAAAGAAGGGAAGGGGGGDGGMEGEAGERTLAAAGRHAADLDGHAGNARDRRVGAGAPGHRRFVSDLFFDAPMDYFQPFLPSPANSSGASSPAVDLLAPHSTHFDLMAPQFNRHAPHTTQFDLLSPHSGQQETSAPHTPRALHFDLALPHPPAAPPLDPHLPLSGPFELLSSDRPSSDLAPHNAFTALGNSSSSNSISLVHPSASPQLPSAAPLPPRSSSRRKLLGERRGSSFKERRSSRDLSFGDDPAWLNPSLAPSSSPSASPPPPLPLSIAPSRDTGAALAAASSSSSRHRVAGSGSGASRERAFNRSSSYGGHGRMFSGGEGLSGSRDLYPAGDKGGMRDFLGGRDSFLSARERAADATGSTLQARGTSSGEHALFSARRADRDLFFSEEGGRFASPAGVLSSRDLLSTSLHGSFVGSDEHVEYRQGAFGSLERVEGGGGGAGERRELVAGLRELKEVYVVGRAPVGRGQYGTVRKCVHRRTGKAYACKSINKRSLLSAAEKEAVRREVGFLERLKGHANIIRMKETIESTRHVHIIMEHCEGGDLLDRIQLHRNFPEPSAARIFRSLMRALQHCHAHGIVHRDVKPENVLIAHTSSHRDALSSSRPGAGHIAKSSSVGTSASMGASACNFSSDAVKLIDFGVATLYSPDKPCQDIIGTSEYMAPEVFDQSYGPESDVWSAGIVLFMLVIGRAPYSDPPSTGGSVAPEERPGWPSVLVAKEAGFYGVREWEKLSAACKHRFICWMLLKDPNARPTPQQVLDHEWLSIIN
ncbi:unnamed protein product [Closterium sp. Yama58-4]|nr:unnamed protein product [Closterium sp. Yama58-4]